jgi:tetratricopeptide (TPR) repeat protein
MAVARAAAGDMNRINPDQFTNRSQMALTAKAGEDLASLLFMFEGDARSSRSLLESARVLRVRALEMDPDNLESLEGMAWHHVRVGQYEVGSGMLEESLETFGFSKVLRDQIARLAPDDFSNRRETGRLLFWMGRAHERIGQIPEAVALHKAALDIRQEMADRDPDDITLRWNLAVSRSKVAEMELNAGNVAVAERELSATLVILSQIPLGTIGNRDYAGARAATLLVHGRLLNQRNELAGATAEWQEAVAILQNLEKSAPYEYFNLRALAEGLLYLDRVSEAEAVATKLRRIGYNGEILSRMLVERGLQPL